MRSWQLIGTFVVGSSLLTVSGCATSALLEQELTKTNKQTALAFEETVFNKHEVPDAFRHYIGEGFIEHDPRLAGTPGRGTVGELGPAAQAAERAYRALIAQQGTQAHRIFARSIAQGQLVAIQSQWVRSARNGGTLSRVDIYRLRDGRIVEHWDVAEPLVPSAGMQGSGGDAVPGASLPP